MKINSKEYWDKRFEKDWDNNGGSAQTQKFGEIFIENIPYWISRRMEIEQYSICDMGCAFGEMINQIRTKYPNNETFGIDISDTAIEEAKKRYPETTFIASDIMNVDNKYDVIVSSNTLEHFEKPIDVIKKMISICNKHLIIMVPYKQYDYFEEHESFFDLNSFPLCIDDFVLSYHKIIDGTKIEETPWNGEQIFIVYSNRKAIIDNNSKLSDSGVSNSNEKITEFIELTKLLNERIAEINTLNLKNDELRSEIDNKAKEIEKINKNYEELSNRIVDVSANNKLKDLLIKEKEDHIALNDLLVKEKDKTIESSNLKIESIIKELNDKDQIISDCKMSNNSLNSIISQKDMIISQLNVNYNEIAIYIKRLEMVVYWLKELSWSKSEKIALFIRMNKYYLKNDFKKFLLIFPKSLLKIFGKKNVFIDYFDNDLLYKQIKELSCCSNDIQNFVNNSYSYDSLNKIFKEKDDAEKNNIDLVNKKRKTIAYFTNQVIDWNDGSPRYGGGEKYLLNLCRLLEKYGYDITIYQPAYKLMEKKYYGFKVKTLLFDNDVYSEFSVGIANKFYEISLNYDHVIYNLPEYSSQKMRKDAIMVCHGIWFDHNNYSNYAKFREEQWFKLLKNAFSNPLKIVSVDTNSINVIRALFPELAQKMTFIPNFVDTQLFVPPKKRDDKKLNIVFPRRAQINRGSRLLGDILKEVKHDVNIYWVGVGDEEDNKIINNLCKKDKRLHFEKASFDDMVSWYQKADISVVPTIACEGTSLSAIEAIACGSAVVTTNVGGLTDVIYNEINGLAVNATAHDIAQAINRLIEDKNLREKLQKAGYEFAQKLSLEKWSKKWLDVFYDLKWIEKKDKKNPRICILTRNAIHGGVESLIKSEADYFNANVIVTGGLNNPYDSCPFDYKYIDNYKDLLFELTKYDVCIYHYLPDWAVSAVDVSNIFSIEFVHRTDTAESDKQVPTVVASHSKYVLDYIDESTDRHSDLYYVPNGVDMDIFKPNNKRKKNKFIGAVTSYYMTKGIDILIEAWSMVDTDLKKGYKLVLAGAGQDFDKFSQLASKYDDIVLDGPTTKTKEFYDNLYLYVTAARIEGLPISVLEAMSCNLPIIASDIEGHTVINDIATKHKLPKPLILFKTEDAKDLKEKIEDYLKEPKDVNSREVIEKEFSIKKHCEGLNDIINKKYLKKGEKNAKN